MNGASGNAAHATAAPRRLPRPAGPALAAAYVLVCLLPVGLAASRTVAPVSLWEAGGAVLGLAGLVGMAVQFVTSGRFESVSGRLGIDRIMAFHKLAARGVLVAILLHPLLLVAPTLIASPAFGLERLVAYLTLPHYRTGVVAFAALAVLVATSVLRDRLPWRYEAWRAVHLCLGLVAVGAGLHHAVSTGRFSASGPVLAVWWAVGVGIIAVMAVLYGWRWLRLHQHSWRLRSVTRIADRLWELDVQPAPGTPAMAYEAGQFVWMTEGRRRCPLFDHPFSIADSPLRPGLRLIVKEAGDFTGRIGALSPGTVIGLDGPYGDFTLAGRTADAVVLLAGGVGIAPVMGILRDMAARGETRPVRLAYAAGRPDTMACLTEIEFARSVLDLQVMLVSEEPAPTWTGLVGRLDRARLAVLLQGLDPARTLALICGPGPMVTAVSDALVDLGVPMSAIVYERFDYGGGLRSRQDRRSALAMVAVGVTLSVLLAALVPLLGR